MKVMQDKKITYVTFMLDDSGSMHSVVDETLIGFNRQLETVKKMEGPTHEVFVSFVKFSDSHRIQTVREFIKASELKPLTKEDYKADGGTTALLDAMMYSIELTESKAYSINQGRNAALVIFVTDGGENSSRRITDRNLVKEKIQSLQKTDKWTFTYMGVEGIDAVSSNFGIAMGNVALFAAGAKGMHTNSARNEDSLMRYATLRGTGATASSNFYDDKDSKSE